MTPVASDTPDIAVTRTLACFAAGLRFEDLPTDVVERCKLLFMDLSGIIIRSQALDSTLVLKAALRDLDLDGGRTLVQGSAERWRPQAAALLAGAAAHSLDFDDTHAPAQLHPGAPVIAAALAAAQMVDADTRALLTAIVAGYEVMIRVALGLPVLKHGERGFHPSATVGVFGATAAAGHLLGLDPLQMEHAFGTALSESAGTGQFVVNGAWTKRFHVGNAAAGGVLAASLARRGYTGATQAFEGREGFFKLYSPEPQPEKAVQGLGTDWEILRSGLKPYPCCRGIHAPLDAVMALHARHDIRIDQIESVRVGLARRSVFVVGEPQARRREPQNVVDCQFSTHLCLSIALKHRRMGWDDYEAALADPDIRALMQRIDVYEDAECEANFPTAFSGVVEIRGADGQMWREFVYQPRGEPETMLTPTELRAKFSLLVRDALGDQGESALFSAIQAMEQGRPVSSLFIPPVAIKTP
ncbi:MmgE/PrpD family protein [Hydrogenophaga electricum]|uniref:2-methylcitrate dehydratase n=1 Tax=Hydrogenophaga electricum TaxID=1230953 RepID=A0ABQ6C2L9_9BURK|nr:MmgE/PrpD family protein [Hydrogenophaga electricum]GLS14593.1 2-methylcitrate dehydratase [Hydrogenophaga electricum]